MLALQFGEPEGIDRSVLHLPANVEKEWLDIVAKIVRSRVTAFPKQGRVELFCWLDDRKKPTCDLLTNIITTEAGMALDELVFNPVS